MQTNTKRILIATLLMLVLRNADAWGPEGHRIIGAAAFGLLDDTARAAVMEILGNPGRERVANELDRACNWPDAVREQDEWSWTAPFHYVNIPRHTGHYDRARDCPDGRCVSEGVLDFANRLSHHETEAEKRWQALAFVCHLVADLHQPLHAGFADDRGGNSVEIRYRGEPHNLHAFWDRVVVRERLGDEQGVVRLIAMQGGDLASMDWSTARVAAWTDESHALAVAFAYPDKPTIDADFAGRTWLITGQRWALASARLAQLLNSVLGENEVLVE